MFKKNFRDNDVNSKIKTILREIGYVLDVSSAKDLIFKYIQELTSFNFDIASVTQNFIVLIVHVL